jgi:hypothetical protein
MRVSATFSASLLGEWRLEFNRYDVYKVECRHQSTAVPSLLFEAMLSRQDILHVEL